MVAVCLGNPYKLQYKWQQLCEELAGLLKKSLNGETVRVYSTMAKPALGPEDVMVYVVPNEEMGRVAEHFDVRDGGNALGCTFTGEKSASEVYIDSEYAGEKLPPDYVAKLIWHEIAHNKSRLGNHKMHRGHGLLQAFVRSRDGLTSDDIKFMRKHIHAQVRQWTGGFDFGAPP
ncbi:hypothetical protein HDIA_2014 [Hartmannibacter diazotrophicus]|uniref:Uncharacterized protein n=1 Tax=Hartmannibacter diazotrophicus TaxID=1482074 RepID=A0A2C9D7N9_9HYPH|nr:hypothetical protein [Hartmannibacter diazotrophicus]SON55555.1 hypothetical protein HDIA_2014 [Hartmannibacter diazotrophicus]